MADEAIRQHQMMAQGKGILGDEKFGTESPFKGCNEQDTPRGTMKEGSRAISRPRGFHPEPDHGGY